MECLRLESGLCRPENLRGRVDFSRNQTKVVETIFHCAKSSLEKRARKKGGIDITKSNLCKELNVKKRAFTDFERSLSQILITTLTPKPLASLTQHPKQVFPARPTTAFSPTLAHQALANNCSSPVPLQSKTTVSSPRCTVSVKSSARMVAAGMTSTA